MERVSQTKLQLANALKDLMQKTSFHKITIQNVTDYCGLNRQTFYYHFKDMFDLLSWIYQNEIFREIDRNQNWRSILLITVNYAQKNKVFLRNTNRSLRKETMEKFLFPAFSKWVTLLFDSACDDSGLKQEDRCFLIGFLTSAFLNSFLQWIGNGMPFDENYLLGRVQLICDMIKQFGNQDCAAERKGGDASAFPFLEAVQAGRNFI